jgi:ferredoxin-NADP reductase
LRILWQASVDVTYVYKRSTPRNGHAPGRIDATLVAVAGWPAALSPTCHVCGPTFFVAHVAELLTASGHTPEQIRTERFGPTGEWSYARALCQCA